MLTLLRYYELALTHLSFGLQVEAIDHFNRAANLLRKRMGALAKDAAEVEELKGIIADVDDKVRPSSIEGGVSCAGGSVRLTVARPGH